MKDKNVAGILALLFGWLGVHRFYLGQPGKGVIYMLLSMVGIGFFLSLIDAILFFVMDKEVFDVKYNRQRQNVERRFNNEGYKSERERYIEHRQAERRERRQPRYNERPQRKAAQPNSSVGSNPKSNPFKVNGIKKFKDYDFEGAIGEFKKALGVNSKDAAVHFNIACAYSMEEQVDEALFHLSKAVENGFVDFDRIKSHDSLAYVRAKDEFPVFVKNGYKVVPQETVSTKIDLEKEKPIETAAPITEEALTLPSPQENILDEVPADLLEQFSKLEELKNKGFLTEQQFEMQKKKLLR